jgi:outer membrane protein insertion porin family
MLEQNQGFYLPCSFIPGRRSLLVGLTRMMWLRDTLFPAFAVTTGKRSLSITALQGNLGPSIGRRFARARGPAVGKIIQCGNGCGRTVHGSTSLQKNHPHPGFARWRLFARVGFCIVGFGFATGRAVAVSGHIGQAAKVVQSDSAATNSSAEKIATQPIIQRSPTFLRYSDLKNWYGLPVHATVFTGVTEQDLAGVKQRLPLQPGKKLTQQNVKESLHALFATGLYRSIVAEGVQTGSQVTITFDGVPQLFLRRLYIEGMKQDILAAQIQRATKLELGESFTAQELDQATDHLRQALERNGFHVPTVAVKTVTAGGQHLVDVIYTVNAGLQAKVGAVKATGTTALTDAKFRKIAKLKPGSTVTANTVPRALTKLRKQYQKQNRLEATVRAGPEVFRAKTNSVDYQFQVNRGPVVRISATGGKISQRDLKRLIPIFDEGAVDPDLLDEGDGNLRDHFQKKGYFDVHVTHVVEQPGPNEENIIYKVDPGTLHKLASVTVTGNHYFDRDLVKVRLAVLPADHVNSHGIYSQQLLAQDVASIQALYKSNGFGNVTVTPLVTDSDTNPGAPKAKVALVQVTYSIHEGEQQKIGRVDMSGVSKVSKATLLGLMNTRPGEPFSLTTLAGDRLQLFDYYYRHGFSQVELEFDQHPDPLDANRVDIDVRVREGNPFYVNRVLISGLHYTKPQVVNKLMEIHDGDPLNRNAILETQRRLYNLALFSEVDTGIVNPRGTQPRKDVLLNVTEAHRWNYDYGFGFEVQTGNPQTNCPSEASLIELGVTDPSAFECSPNGKFGVSPRISFDVSRINLGGRNRTISLQTAYGTLEQQAIMTYNVPKFYDHKTFDFSISGGYVSNQNVTTYEASTLSGSIVFTERPNKANTLIYSMTYRYVYVNPNSLQVSAELIPLLSQPTRVSGPGITWVHDTRNNPLDATSGWYLSAQQFFAWEGFASQANFNRVDVQESNYYRLNKENWILARSTRIGFENTYGDPSYNLIPLPERLYAGGATSHRGFSVNAAGPRDLQTGFPVGGSGAFVNSTELRIPPVPLPLIGNNLGFVVFEDLGNVFQNASDIFPSLFRWHQPNVQTCYNLVGPEGTCNFNYDSQAAGLGLRYKTPVGPIRLDFSYNMNPTVYPVVSDPALLPAVLNYSGQPPYVGNSGHFNFFFSIGQAF